MNIGDRTTIPIAHAENAIWNMFVGELLDHYISHKFKYKMCVFTLIKFRMLQMDISK